MRWTAITVLLLLAAGQPACGEEEEEDEFAEFEEEFEFDSPTSERAADHVDGEEGGRDTWSRDQ